MTTQATDKYYTPSIEEFHVGFEYERLDVNYFDYKEQHQESHLKHIQLIEVKSKSESFTHSPYKTEEWVMETLEPYWSLSDIEEELLANRIRVRYLTHDDIVKEGWVTKTCDNEHRWHFRKTVFSGKENCNVEFSLMLTPIQWVLITVAGIPRFSGTIRNRSELVQVMRMLEIKH